MNKYLKNCISALGNALSVFPLKYIIFESKPDLSDNTKAVFDEMVRRGLNKRYTFVWLCNNPQKCRLDIPNVLFVDVNNKIQYLYYTIRAKCLISCNMMVYSWGNYQKSIYLCHGAALKSLNGYKAPLGIDYAIGQSEAINDIMSRELSLNRDKFIVTGYPRNDSLLKGDNSKRVHSIFKQKYDKIIVWYPTFRQHANSHVMDSKNISIPIIHNLDAAKIVNEKAKQENILIILKPHFSQDVSKIKDLGLENILFINDDFFINNNISSYEFVGGCDALITDYSSIYFDYLLCNKPIAAVWEDIDEYKGSRGFALDVDYYMQGAYKVYNTEDFVKFIKDVATNKDSMRTNREVINGVVNTFADNLSSFRVVDFIESQILSLV